MGKIIGITGYGAYIPRLRMPRSVIAASNAWFDSGLRALASGERSFCNWDEDTITMAVEAGQDCLEMNPPKSRSIKLLYLASTTYPYADRQSSALVAQALNLGSQLRSMDVASSRRAGTTALLAAVDAIRADHDQQALIIASENRFTRSAARQEMLWGDAAAAFTLGGENVLAEIIGSHSLTIDFVDQYRSAGHAATYDWEDRWVRDEGVIKIVPQTITELLENTNLNARQIDHFVFASDQARVPEKLAKMIGIPADAVQSNLRECCGISGTAHSLLMLAHALESASPGELILVAGFGQGCDAILLRATHNVQDRRPIKGVSGSLNHRRQVDNYQKFQSFRNQLEIETGKRGEVDQQNYLSAMYRNSTMLSGFNGGKCRECGTAQFPKTNYCVNPECRALESQVEFSFARQKGRVKTWTADRLTFDWDPPACFGMVEFDGGGRLMMDFSEVDLEEFNTGVPVSMHFRVKYFDNKRGFRSYFWKAIQDVTEGV